MDREQGISFQERWLFPAIAAYAICNSVIINRQLVACENVSGTEQKIKHLFYYYVIFKYQKMTRLIKDDHRTKTCFWKVRDSCRSNKTIPSFNFYSNMYYIRQQTSKNDQRQNKIMFLQLHLISFKISLYPKIRDVTLTGMWNGKIRCRLLDAQLKPSSASSIFTLLSSYVDSTSCWQIDRTNVASCKNMPMENFRKICYICYLVNFGDMFLVV
jgi:hypothetical protein